MIRFFRVAGPRRSGEKRAGNLTGPIYLPFGKLISVEVDLEAESLSQAVETVTGLRLTRPVTVVEAAGGYAWRTLFLTDSDQIELVVRIAPRGGTMEPYSPSEEAKRISALSDAVPAPSVLGLDEEAETWDTPFSVQTKVPGSVLRLADVSADLRPSYRATFARTLGVIHRDVPFAETTVTEAYREELARVEAEYRGIALIRHPGFETGIDWLDANVPESNETAVMCHGDFRFANLSWIGPGELGGVLDWERAWIGDPMADIAFTRQFSGWCGVDAEMVPVYEAAAGRPVDEDRVDFALRFERVRAYLSPLRLMKAFHERRVSDQHLAAIAEAGEAGMWELVDWDARGMVARDWSQVPAIGPDWTLAVSDRASRAHFDAHPRPECSDPDDRSEVRSTAKAWARRPLMKKRRLWN